MDEITFGTDGWRATLDTFTDRRVRIVGQAVAAYLRDEGEAGTVGIGYDAREHSRGFAEELARVLCGNGFDVLLADRDCPTPALAWTVRDRDLAGGLVLTASHNPPEYNGIKFVPGDGAPAPAGVTDAIEERLAEPEPLPESEHGTVAEEDLIGPYVEHCRAFFDVDLDGLAVAYDAMHGSGRDVTDRLLDAAGADVERLRTDRDPEFGGTPPEPSAERLGDLVETVREGEAAIGIANDGDADRIGVVTPERGVLDRSLFFAAIYDYLLEANEGGAVRTVSTSSIVDRVAAAHGIAGHLRNKDGVLLALLSAAATAAEPLDERVDRLEAEYGEVHQDRVSVDCPDDRKAAVLADLDGALPEGIAGSEVERVNDVDGFKIFLADGAWLLVRPSGTEPKLRVYAEATSDERVAELLDAGREIVEPLV
jgi:phosphomannomutase